MKKMLGFFSCLLAIMGIFILASCSGSGIVAHMTVEARRTELEVTVEFDENELLESSSTKLAVKLYDKDETYKNQSSLSFSDGVYTISTCKFSNLAKDTEYILKLYVSIDGEEELLLTQNTATAATGETEDDPIEISTKSEFLNIKADGSACYKLMADIDLGGEIITLFTSSRKFTGVFDGNGHTIKNYSSSGTYAGLFGYCSEATIKNLTVEEFTYKSSSSKPKLGALVGYAEYSTIENCKADNISIELTPSSTISEQRVSVGAIIGEVITSTVKNCQVYNANISIPRGRNKSAVGLFIGTIDGMSDVQNCHAQGLAKIVMNTTTDGAYLYLGGFAGYSSTTMPIKSCYVSGTLDLSAVSNVDYKLSLGGFIGSTYNGITNIENCFAVTDIIVKAAKKDAADGEPESYYKIATSSNIGGFIGTCGSSVIAINNCYTFKLEKGIEILSDAENLNVALLIAEKSKVDASLLTTLYAYDNTVTVEGVTPDLAGYDSTKVESTLSAELVQVLKELKVID